MTLSVYRDTAHFPVLPLWHVLRAMMKGKGEKGSEERGDMRAYTFTHHSNSGRVWLNKMGRKLDCSQGLSGSRFYLGLLRGDGTGSLVYFSLPFSSPIHIQIKEFGSITLLSLPLSSIPLIHIQMKKIGLHVCSFSFSFSNFWFKIPFPSYALVWLRSDPTLSGTIFGWYSEMIPFLGINTCKRRTTHFSYVIHA